MNQPRQIPETWKWLQVGDLCETIAGYGFPKELQGKTKGDLPFFKVGDISEAWQQKRRYLGEAKNYLSLDEARSINAKPLPRNTTVFAKIGAAIELNRRAVLSEPSLVDNNVMGIYPTPEILIPEFLFYFMWTIRLGDTSRATTVPSVRKSDIESIPIPLPPLAEQRRIVAEIETQFTRLDASVAALRRAQANLKRYRASVLKAACEGRLVATEAELARSEGRDFQSAGVLLERILVERRARWESQEKRRGEYKEPSAPDTSDLPQLPEGWVWSTLSQVSDLKGGVTKGQRYRDGQSLQEVAYLRVANVQRGYLNLRQLSMIETTPEIVDQLRLIPGDVLFTEGGDRDKLGRGWVWKGEIDECIHQNHVFRARLLPDTVIPEMVSWWGNSFGQDFFSKVGKQTTNLASINLSVLSQFPIPLPPLAEQRRIVAEVERRLSVVQQAEATVEASLARAERLRQSILKQAFSGKLVPQDPDDEPASVLLERIRAERAAAEASAPRTRKPRTRKAQETAP